ncbi:ABC transporter permease subunit [Actinocorallia longicatena]|uniref:ABC-2 type transport system permease protein n=1 Tax=Actinocorallia longicatena TaxID=111803 RepID=A0ABP6QHW0_9ACTN
MFSFDVLQAEWTKLRTLRSTHWLVLAIVAFTVLVGLAGTAGADVSHCPAPDRCFEDTPKLALNGVRLAQVAVVVLAVLSISAEYGTGTILPTLTVVPRRGRVLAAKAIVLTGVTVASAVLATLTCLLLGRHLLPDGGFTPANGYPLLSPTDGPTLRATAGTVLYLALIALLSLSVATIVRDTAGALTTVLALLFILPILTEFISDPTWHDRLNRWSPMTAGLTIQVTVGVDHLKTTPWQGLSILTAYTLTALLLATLTLTRRDA